MANAAGVLLNGPEAHRSRKPALIGIEPFVSAFVGTHKEYVMKKFSRKGVLLFVGAMAVCAFTMPSMASAASWGVIGSHHTLDGAVGFGSPLAGLTSSCSSNSFTSRVDNAGNLTITTASFGGLCTTSIPAAGADCTTTARGTGFPWRVTARTTTLIDLHDVHIHWRFEDMPGRAGSCGALNNTNTTFTGTLTNGHWNPANRTITWNNAHGLHSNTWGPVTVLGAVRDTQQTLTVSP
jgi:hypothetical protein